MWNPESTGMESGIHSVESGIHDSLGLPYMGRIVMNCILYTGMVAGWLKNSAVLRSCAYESRNTDLYNTVFVLMHTQV